MSAYSSATLSFDWRTQSLESGETLAIQISTDGASYTTLTTFGGASSGSFSQDISAYMASGTTIRFAKGSNNWSSSGDLAFIDNVLISAISTPVLNIDDVSVNENAGTATFTVTHNGLNTSGAFTANYQTVDGTALSGTHYTSSTGTLSFNGTVGDTEQITVPIIDNTLFDGDKNFSIQFTSVSDISVIIADVGTGTIVNNELVLGNTPLTLFEELDGYMDYTSTGGTLRTSPNTGNPCAITTSSSNTLSSPIPAAGIIEKAILYWAHSGAATDTHVSFEGTTINAELVYMTTLTTRTFHGYYADVTSLVLGIGNPSTNVYDFSGLTVDTSSTYCSSATVLGGWSLMIFYTDTSLPASTINLYQGFDGNSNSSSTFTLSGFYAIGSTGSKTTALSWEGDQTLANNESLQFTTLLVGTNRLSGDGDLDIFFDSHNYGIELLRNNYINHSTHTIVNPPASGLFTHITTGNGSGVVNFGLNQFATDGDYGTAADVDDDGWVDIFMRKRDENDFFLNQGGTFTSGSDLAQADNGNKGGNGLWDLDNDGDLDAVWTENGLTQIFRNDGPGVWTALGGGVFPGLPQPANTDSGNSSNTIDALAGGDIDNDGDIDVLLVGDNRSYLFINQLNSQYRLRELLEVARL